MIDWRVSALCAQVDPELFFPESGVIPRDAVKVCDACAVKAECLEFAVEHRLAYGVFGGMTARQRRALLPPVEADLCKNGHSWAENSAYWGDQVRYCAQCHRDRERAKRARERARKLRGAA